MGLHVPLQSPLAEVENCWMETRLDPADPIVPEHVLATSYGILALVLGAAAWSGMAVVFGAWSLPAAPGLGWLIAWACRHGGRRGDGFVRVAAWLLAPAGAVLALLASSAFAVAQGSPDSGFGLRSTGAEFARLFTEAPWFGSAAVVLTLAGARFALRDRPSRRAAARPSLDLARAVGDRPPASRASGERAGSRAA